MHRSDRQHRIRVAEDVFLKAILFVVLVAAVGVGVTVALSDDPPETQVKGLQVTNNAASPPRQAQPVIVTTLPTTTTTLPALPPVPRPLTPAEWRAFAAALARAQAVPPPVVAPPPPPATTPTTQPPPPPPSTTTSTSTSTSTTTTTTEPPDDDN